MNPLRSAPLLLLAVLAAAPISAQGGIPLVLETSDPQIAHAVTTLIGYDEELPALKPRQNWKLRLLKSGEIKVGVGQGLIVRAQIVVRPALLKELFADEIESIRTSIHETYSAALGQTRFEATQIEELSNLVTNFPSQISRLRILVRGETGTEEGLTVEFWFVAARESWLAEFVSSVRASPFPVPSLATDGTTLSLRIGMLLHDDHAEELAAPFVEFFSKLSPMSDRGFIPTNIIEGFLKAFDGRMALQWNARTGSMSFACGMNEPEHVRALVESEYFPEWLESPPPEQSERATYTPNAANFLGLPFYKSVASLDTGISGATPTPLRGEIVSYGGMAGDYFVGATGASEEEMTTLVEKALADKFAESALSVTVFARLRLRLAEYAAQMNGGSSAGFPERVTVAFGSGTTVRHDTHFHPNREDPQEMFVKVIIK